MENNVLIFFLGIIVFVFIMSVLGVWVQSKKNSRIKNKKNDDFDKQGIADIIGSIVKEDEAKLHENRKQDLCIIEKEIQVIKEIYISFFENWRGEDYNDIEYIKNNFIKFSEKYSLTNNFLETENKVRFCTGEMFPENTDEINSHPNCTLEDISKLQKINKTTYSKDDVNFIRGINSCKYPDTLSSYPLHDELMNFESKISLRLYFHSIEISFIKYLIRNTSEYKEFAKSLKIVFNDLKIKYGDTVFENIRLRDDLYNILMNISKMLDETEIIERNMSDCLSVEMYKRFSFESFNLSDFEFYGNFRKKYDSKFIDGRHYDGYLKTNSYYYYNFLSQSKNKEYLFVNHERNYIKLIDLIINSLTFFELIINDYITDEKFNKYLMLRIDIEKHGLLLSHFEGTILSKIDDLNFNFIELKSVLKRNNIETLEALDRINDNINNISPSLSLICNKINEVGDSINSLDKTNKWQNLYQVANLYYNYKSYKLVKNK